MTQDNLSYFTHLERLLARPSRPAGDTAALVHLPFLRWLLATMAPKVVLRLGLGSGDAYLALCESAAASDPPPTLHGVAVRPGPEGTTAPGELPAELRADHDRRFRHISTLSAETAEAALARFDSGTLDLVYLDAGCLGDAVEAVAEAGLARLSQRGALLLDGIDAEAGDVRAVLAWRRLSGQHAAFALDHGGGLGVLVPGAAPGLSALTQADGQARRSVAAAFATLGDALAAGPALEDLEESARALRMRLGVQAEEQERLLGLVREHQRVAHDQIDTITRLTDLEARRQEELRQWINRFQDVDDRRRREMEAKTQEIERQRGEIDVRGNEISRLQGEIEARGSEISRLRTDFEARGREVAELRAESEGRGQEIHHLHEAVAERDRRLAALEAELHSVYASRSWRVTAPLRALLGLRYAAVSRAKPLVRRTVFALPGGRAAYTRLAEAKRRRAASAAEAESAEAAPERPPLEQAKEAFRERTRAEFDAFLATEEVLKLPAPERPKVSILLVLYNQAPLTLACLRSLAAHAGDAAEVVIVDNASSDETGALLARVEGARVLRNDENAGFLRAVNQGAAEASGDFLLLLNNDALLRAGTLDAALAVFDEEADVGAVGGRIVLPDGRLQEAGNIIWNDGSCLGYARGLDPEAGEAMVRRDVDYCSGVFLLLRRETFAEMGGFDERFAPAYYEETDLCLRLWEDGRRVVYEPGAVVDHLEFGSSQKSGDALALQQRNQTIFAEKHAARLEQAHYPPDERNILFARSRDDGGRGRVLMIDDLVPVPTNGAGYPRANEIVWTLHGLGYTLTHYPALPADAWETTYAHLPRRVEVAAGRGEFGLQRFLEERRGYYGRLLVSRPHNMERIDRLWRKSPELFEGVRIVYDAEAVFAKRDIIKAEVLGVPYGAAAAEEMLSREMACAKSAAEILTVSPLEAETFREAGYTHVHVLGHSLQPAPTPRVFAERAGLLFVGRLNEDDTPNTDSLVWFVNEVLPRLRDSLGPATRLSVAGPAQAPRVQEMSSRDVDLLGRVDSLVPVYDRHRVFVAPTRYAGGIPHKVHEAAAHGVPCVVTSLLARQLGWTHDHEVLVADTPADFADACARLHTDETLWQRLRDAALARIAEECAPEAFRATLERAIADGTEAKTAAAP